MNRCDEKSGLSEEPHYFKLYIIKDSPRSLIALENIKPVLEEGLGSDFTLDIIDVFESPEKAEEDKITAVPALIRVTPKPVKRLIGDFSNIDQVRMILSIHRNKGN